MNFANNAPVTVMARGMLENIISPAKWDDIFQHHVRTQRQRTILFSFLVELMLLVACKSRGESPLESRSTPHHLLEENRRLKVLREQNAAPLPGFALVVFEPAWNLVAHDSLLRRSSAKYGNNRVS